MVEYKKCTKCCETKPLLDYYPSPRNKLGVESICKACSKLKYQANKERASELGKKRYSENREAILEKAKEYGVKNKEAIAIKDSIRHKKKRLENHGDALINDAAYRLKNLEAVRGYKKKWEEENREELVAKRKKDYQENKEEDLARSKEWCSLNPEKSREIKRRWKDNNPDIVAKSRIKRDNVKKQCVPSWADTEWDKFLVKEICHLARIRTQITGYMWHVDHRVPLVSNLVCGFHCSDNLQAIPAKINLAKSNLIWEDMP